MIMVGWRCVGDHTRVVERVYSTYYCWQWMHRGRSP